MTEFHPEGFIVNLPQNRAAMASPSALAEACGAGTILEARAVVCDSDHNLLVELGCMRGIIPREEGAVGIREGTVRDIAMISKVNKPVSFVVKSFEKDSFGMLRAILSRREAQEICQREYIKNLRRGDVIPARVTHLDSFGAFADIGCGIPSLIPIDSLSVSRIEHSRERFTSGMEIRAVIKSKDDTGRVCLSHKELLGSWEENAARFQHGETVAGIVRSVEEYGVFVELTPNLAGLAEPREGVRVGQQASVYIKALIPERMKIKLIIIDTFSESCPPPPPVYYYHGSHLDRFVYSPTSSDRLIESRFDDEETEFSCP